MTRRNRYETSTIAWGSARGANRILVAGLSVLVALALVLGAIASPALADDAHANSAAAAKDARTSTLTPGQLEGGSSATVLVYMNGSDLESQAGEATSDIAEMLDSGIGANANVVIETLGTSKWQNFGIASDHTQRYRVNQGKLELVDDSLGQLDTTDPNTLADFIAWGVKNYPAERYILLLWDHGAGPVYGFGYDEFQSEESALTLDEMKQALAANPTVHFDIIGMDCCIMGSLETCLVLQPYCDYMVVSEDFEPGVGWSYKGWMSLLEQQPGVDTVKLGETIVDDMIADVAKDEENGDATLALVDESAIDELYDAWVGFAYANKDELLGTNYSQETEWRVRPGSGRAQGHGSATEGSGHSGDMGGLAGWAAAGCADECDAYGSGCDSAYGLAYGFDDFEGCFDSYEGAFGDYGWDRFWEDWDYDGSFVTMTDYFVTDIMEVASSIDGNEAAALKSAFENAMVHFGSTSGEQGMSGLGVTLPYSDGEFYDELVKVFKSCGIDGSYVDWLEAFVSVESASGNYGFDGYSSYGASYGYNDYGFGYDSYGYDGRGYDDGSAYGYGYDDGSGYGYGYDRDSEYGFGSDDSDGSYGYGPGNSHGHDSGSGLGYGFGYAQVGHGHSTGSMGWVA